ncbi:MAG: hypothetical protein EB127_08350 [Alphaproteobacteria bacterium]|nr:hypothetical protein [Alphaproteobacteria bacterium]
MIMTEGSNGDSQKSARATDGHTEDVQIASDLHLSDNPAGTPPNPTSLSEKAQLLANDMKRLFQLPGKKLAKLADEMGHQVRKFMDNSNNNSR